MLYLRCMFSQKYSSRYAHNSRFKNRLVIALLSVVALVSAYILAAPYLPKLYFYIFKPRIDSTSYAEAARSHKKTTSQPGIKSGNRLILPDIGIDTQVFEGASIAVISQDQGVWRETNTTTPDKDGNIVIAGHRFMYRVTDGGRFYNLTELKKGAKLYLTWDNTVYEYQVYDSYSVLPTQIDIRNFDPSTPRKLTLYTCYPLGSTAKRYVVEARQLSH